VKLRNFGLSTGLSISAVAIVVGIILIFMADSLNFVSGKSGGGFALLMQWIGYWLLYGLGYLSAAVGVITAITTITGWFLSKGYNLLNPHDKKKVQWVFLILLVLGISAITVTLYFRSQPEAIAQRAREAEAEHRAKEEAEVLQKASEIEIANKKLKSMNDLIVGKWENEFNQWKPSLIFDDQGTLYTTHTINQIHTASTTWALSVNNKPPYHIILNSPYSVVNNKYQANTKVNIVTLDEQLLILEKRCRFNCDKKFIRETYKRVVGEERCQIAKEEIKGLWAVTDANDENTQALFQDDNIVYYTNVNGWVYKGRWTLRCSEYRSDSINLYLRIVAKTCPKCAQYNQDIYISQLDSKQLLGGSDPNGKNKWEQFSRSSNSNETAQVASILKLIVLKQKEEALKN
jgi:hypothetical protein